MIYDFMKLSSNKTCYLSHS